MSNWKLTEGDQSTFIYELGEDGINKWNCDVQPGFSGGKRASSEYLHSIALKMRAADELYEALEMVRSIISEGAAEGFNPMSGDWAERLFNSQQKTSYVVKKARGKCNE